MVEKSELLRVPAFADLPDDQIAWFISQSQELHLKAGDTYARQGDPADSMFVILEGRLQGRGELAGEAVIFDLEPGDVTGVLPFSRMKRLPWAGEPRRTAAPYDFPLRCSPN
jgi:CRP-like cAMP-binding protein